MIGTLGNIVFEVTADSVLTWQSALTTSPARWVKHEPIAQAPVSEFLGVGLRTQTFSVYLSADLGVDPAEFIGEIREAQLSGVVLTLVLGDTVYGANGWVVLSFTEAWDQTESNGVRSIVTVNLTLEEYGA